MTEHVVSVLSTRDKRTPEQEPAYRAVCSSRFCWRWHGPYRPLTPEGFDLAEHDAQEHRKYRDTEPVLTNRPPGAGHGRGE